VDHTRLDSAKESLRKQTPLEKNGLYSVQITHDIADALLYSASSKYLNTWYLVVVINVKYTISNQKTCSHKFKISLKRVTNEWFPASHPSEHYKETPEIHSHFQTLHPTHDITKFFEVLPEEDTHLLRGGAINTIHDTIDDIPYTLALQSLWEEGHKRYKDLEPKYQQMLPEPDEAPIEALKEPFHRYMDEEGDQELLEEARDTIGLMAPDEADTLFVNDSPRITTLYEQALPEVDDRLIPIFIRADMLRFLL